MRLAIRSLSISSVVFMGACSGQEAPPVMQEYTAAGSNPAGNLDQWADCSLAATQPCSDAAWVNGNLNESKAHYVEGDSVPYRLRLSNLAGGSHDVRIEWDTTEQGKHALDYVTSFDRTEAPDPCADVAGCAPQTFSTFPIPIDPLVTAGPDGVPGSADDIAQVPGTFRLYGGTITAVSGYTVSGVYSGSSQTSITITFTASGDPVLAWGGHISLRTNWRPELTAADVSGSPYHTRFLDLDGAGGNQDRSLSAAAVYNLPNLIVIKHVINDNSGTKVASDFEMTVTGPTPDPATFPGAEDPGTLVTLGAPGDYGVTEGAHDGYAVTYSTDCTGTLGYDDTATCTVTNDDVDRCIGVTCDAATECMQAGVCNPATGECDYTPVAAGTACTDDGNVCTTDVCDGLGACSHPPGNAGTVCRAADGVCDVAEQCTGLTAQCPDDSLAPPTQQCRASAGACDVAEYCTGTSKDCPTDVKSTAVCRPSAGICDVEECCDGVSNDCPPDTFAPSGDVCRVSAGICDVAETCTGTSAFCPADQFQPSGQICRPSAGDCDVAETCTGSSAACPADQFQSSSQICRPSAGDCDVAENCTGSSATCPPDAFQSSSQVCRPSAGDCDVAENCTGSSATCPPDAFASNTQICRTSAGVCDVAETCTGSSASCPPDAFAPNTDICRASAGVCDVAENCTGSSAACPPDAFLPSTEICRASAGACDVAENCTGSSAGCPDDVFLAAGTVCRPSTGECDPAETCTGSSGTCPTDVTGTCSLCGYKFYDANANGVFDGTELGVAGWQILLTTESTSQSTFTDSAGAFDFNNLAEGDYNLCEGTSTVGHWMQVAPTSGCFAVHVPTDVGGCPYDFGNLCLGGGGGHTIGFWTNRNGQAAFMGGDSGASALALLDGLNLRNANGSNFDPTSYGQVQTWLSNATAVNMAYMLSAQLAAMELNVGAGFVDGDHLVYAPGTSSANSLGFATIDAVMSEANTELGLHGYVPSGSEYRSYQQALKNALDQANNNLSFVQPGACAVSFAIIATAMKPAQTATPATTLYSPQ